MFRNHVKKDSTRTTVPGKLHIKSGLPFSQRYTTVISRLRWPVVVLWLACAVASVGFLPKLDTVVAHARTNFLPPNSPVVQGQTLLNEISPHTPTKSTAVIAIHNPNGLTTGDKEYFRNRLSTVESNPGRYGVTSIQSLYNTDARLAPSFLSNDGTTEIALAGFPHNEASDATASALQRVRHVFTNPPSDATLYLTGDAPIQQDNIYIVQKGVQKTSGITVVLVLMILLLMFRSLVAPFVTLLTVGVSFLITSGIVAWLAQRGLPASSFTQPFLIAVMFGAGTDYSIIIISRFREELTRNGGDKELAIANALRAVFKTVVFSASTVVVSFAVLCLARFGLYRSAAGVGLGVVIVLLACLTLIPSLMSLLGPSMFWPLSPEPGALHPSIIWSHTGRIATRRPWWTLLALFIILMPITFLFTDERTFNPMDDIPGTPSVTGFNTVAKAFGPGRVIPMQMVLRTSGSLRTPEGLTTIEHMSHAMASLSSVSQIYSATRPTGSAIAQFQIANQNQEAAQGLGKVEQGINKLQAQLGTIQTARDAAFPRGTLLPPVLVQGSAQLTQGLNQTVAEGNQLVGSVNQLSQSAQQLAQNTSALANAIALWSQRHPGTSGTPEWDQIVRLATAGRQNSQQFTSALMLVNQTTGRLAAQLTQLRSNAGELDQGLRTTVIRASKWMPAGEIKSFSPLLDRQLQSWNQAVSGVNQLHSGVAQVHNYLTASSEAVKRGDPGFFIPSSTVAANPELRKTMDAYISPDGHVTKFTIVLTSNPYSSSAMSDVPLMQSTAQVALAGSPLHQGQIFSAGTTPVQAELNNISSNDFARTVRLILAAIFLLLVLMLRSIVTPLYIILSLSGTYFVTMGLLQFIVNHILNKPGLSWPVPFFVFLLLVALGVDYSIFLMSRFEEEMKRGLTPKQGIQVAMEHMGKVVVSATVIMAGTFGAMVVTGVSSLVEIGIAVVVGLFIYFAVVLAFFVPACVSVLGRAHFWPFVPHGFTRRSNRGAYSLKPNDG